MALLRLHCRLIFVLIRCPSFLFSHPILTRTLIHPSLMQGLVPYMLLPQVILLPAHWVILRDGQPVLALLTCNQELLEPLDGLSRLTHISGHSCNSNNRVIYRNHSKALTNPWDLQKVLIQEGLVLGSRPSSHHLTIPTTEILSEPNKEWDVQIMVLPHHPLHWLHPLQAQDNTGLT